MKDPLKPRDKITQKMTRDGAIAENQTTGDTERISNRIRDADLQKTPEQQAAQDASAASPVHLIQAPSPCAGSCPQSGHRQNGARHGAYRRRPYTKSQ